MRDIAGTDRGRRLLAAGLVTHGAALLGGMVTAAAGGPFFAAAYPLAVLLLAAGAVLELRDGGGPRPGAGFWLAALLSPLPLVGPLCLLGGLYRRRHGALRGFPAALGGLRAGAGGLLSLLLALLLLFALLEGRTAPYVQKHRPVAVPRRTGPRPSA